MSSKFSQSAKLTGHELKLREVKKITVDRSNSCKIKEATEIEPKIFSFKTQ